MCRVVLYGDYIEDFVVIFHFIVAVPMSKRVVPNDGTADSGQRALGVEGGSRVLHVGWISDTKGPGAFVSQKLERVLAKAVNMQEQLDEEERLKWNILHCTRRSNEVSL